MHSFLSLALLSGRHRQRQAEGRVFWVMPEGPKSLESMVVNFLQILIVLKDVGRCLEISAGMRRKYSVN